MNVKIGCITESREPLQNGICRRLVTGSNLEVASFLVSRGLFKVLDARPEDLTDADLLLFPRCDWNELISLRDRNPVQ